MLLVSPERIAAVMALAPLPHSFAELDEMVARGLPKGALKASIDQIYVSAEERRQLLYRIIPEATYKRRRETLSAEESGRAERLARVFATAAYVWNSEEVSLTELGARRVEELLWRLFYGIAA